MYTEIGDPQTLTLQLVWCNYMKLYEKYYYNYLHNVVFTKYAIFKNNCEKPVFAVHTKIELFLGRLGASLFIRP